MFYWDSIIYQVLKLKIWRCNRLITTRSAYVEAEHPNFGGSFGCCCNRFSDQSSRSQGSEQFSTNSHAFHKQNWSAHLCQSIVRFLSFWYSFFMVTIGLLWHSWPWRWWPNANQANLRLPLWLGLRLNWKLTTPFMWITVPQRPGQRH